MDRIETIEQLEEIYGRFDDIAAASKDKEIDYLTPSYRQMIEASSFVALASVGARGVDCSPRGDKGQVVYCINSRQLHLPDRRGNNRIDTLRNLIEDPRLSLMFLIKGSGSVIRVIGRAIISVDPNLCEKYQYEGKLPRSVLVIDIERVFFQCARAIMRAELWSEAQKETAKSLPTAGQMLKEATSGQFDGDSYDRGWLERAEKTMW
ncbi:pyridoxamine 5'-phosphate oxidase family protein [Polycladidibacter stylochi]|uniref:pyridoxamine 5'-phosphate oxidase family protein n=1 Tax=Polycladidibacter stylochi TaxID=1807766 RepID=UPI0008334369|nr:pyridoxamine 5'-phosphate oxidase family protein [Pseudovibrio stylochi]